MNIPGPDFAELLDEGIAHHRAGRLSQAVAVYGRILDAVPEHADALHLLGLAAHQFGQKEQALTLVTRAVASRPNIAGFHNSRGVVLSSLGRNEEAVRAFETALGLDAAYHQARTNLDHLTPPRNPLQPSFLPPG
jgi:Flp pilus assembly protein TadD